MRLIGYMREFKGHNKDLSLQFSLNPQITIPSTNLLILVLVSIRSNFFFVDAIYYSSASCLQSGTWVVRLTFHG